MKENRRLVHIHTPVQPDAPRVKSVERLMLRLKNRRVIFAVYPDFYILTFKSLMGGKVIKTTVPLSREAMAAVVAMYESMPQERQEVDTSQLFDAAIPLRKPQIQVVTLSPTDASAGSEATSSSRD